MSTEQSWFAGRRRSLVMLVVGVAIGATMITPASAHVGGTFTHLWSKHIKPAALKVFYTKTQSNAKYASKSSLRDPGVINTASNPVAWSKLKGVPGDMADGSDDGWEAVAAGTILADGTPGWGNTLYGWSVTHTPGTGVYLITIPGAPYQWQFYSTLVTPVCAGGLTQAADDGAGKLSVQIRNFADGSPLDCAFQFVTF